MSNEYVIVNGELMHYGVPGMKWGKRTVRGHAGPGNYLTKKRRLAGDKKDLEYLNKGGHLSVGLTKKRQAAYDKRDKAALEKRIDKTEEKLKNHLDKKRKETRQKFEEDQVRRQGGEDAVKRLKQRREQKQRRAKKEAIFNAKGKEKAKLIVKNILERYNDDIEKRKPKSGRI